MAEIKITEGPRTVTVLRDLRILNELNDKLRADIQDSKHAREILIGTMSRIESEAMRHARDAKNDEGKSVNTNDTLRNAAAEGEILDNQDYQMARKAMVTLEDDVATAKRMLEFNAGDWKILMAEVDLLVAQMASNVKVAAIEALGEV